MIACSYRAGTGLDCDGWWQVSEQVHAGSAVFPAIAKELLFHMGHDLGAIWPALQ